MIKLVGDKSGKVYATGTKADCFRKLNEQFPYEKNTRKVYPEPLWVVRV